MRRQDICLPCRFELKPCGCPHCARLYAENVQLHKIVREAAELVIELYGQTTKTSPSKKD